VKALVSEFALESASPALDITLFSSSWKDRLTVTPDLAGVKSIDRRVPVSCLNFMWHRLEWPTAERLTRSRFDLTHSLHPLLLPSRDAARVVTIHDLNFLTHPERTQREIRRDYPRLARSHAHRADHIIVVSRFTAGKVESILGVPPDRISVCSPGAPEWPARVAAPSNGYLLFFGTLEPRKNVGWLLDAYERLLAHRDASAAGPIPPLVLAGQATAESRPWLDRIARPPLAGSVRHIGYVEPGDRQALYQGARMLVQPSFEEGFGIPPLEAMTLGVPVVAADRGALPEVVGDAGFLVNETDAEGLAAAMAQMIDQPSLAAACAAKGVVRARQFRWADTARRVREAYSRAIERRLRKAS
jgi:glycosyltransferase involved in cell wall biosynthesis